MGFEIGTQYSGTVGGLGTIESGPIIFEAGQEKVDVATRLTTCYLAIAYSNDADESTGQPILACTDRKIGAGGVTFTRRGSERKEFTYLVLGY